MQRCVTLHISSWLWKGGTEYQILGELFSDMENALVALTLWKRVLSYIKHILRILGETLWVTPQYLMAIISDNDKELSTIFVMVEALKKWDEVYGLTA